MPDQTNNPVDDLATCVGKDLIAFLNQPNPWGRCYAYPQYVLGEAGAQHIDATRVFPDKGCLPVTLVGHETADYAKGELGDIAVLRLNVAPQEQAERYYKKDHNRYFTKFRLPDTERDSFASLIPLREETAGGGLVEVVGLGEEWDFSTQREGPFRPYKIPRRILTDVVVVSPRSEFMHKVFGPFRAKRDKRGGLYLRALEEFDYQIGAFDYYDWQTFLIVNDRKRHALASFVTMDELRSRLRQSPTRYDWIPDDVLLGLLKEANEARLGGTADDVPAPDAPGGEGDPFGRLTSIPDNLRLSDARARRLQQMVSDRAKWEGIFRDFDSRLAQSEEELQATLSSLGDEVAQRQAERDRLAAECAELEERTRDEAERYGGVIAEQADAVARRLEDSASLTQDVLQSEMLRRVVAQIGRPSSPEAEAPTLAPELRPGAGTMSAADIVSDVRDGLRRTPWGAQLSRNDVANLLVCLTQGPLLTIAGLPGTGKTSLARTLAASLGLTGEGAPRLCEVPVEHGWESYRDLLASPACLGSGAGTQVLRTSDVLALLDREGRTKAEGEATPDTAPFLLLLDDAGEGAPERYLAPLLRAADPGADPEAWLPLEDGRSLAVPRQLLLLATVTTGAGAAQPSLRLLDRSWVVTLEPRDIDLAAPYEADPLAALRTLKPLSMATLERAFGYHGEELPEAARDRLAVVIGTCREHGMPLSPRSQRMMRDYVAVASRVMVTDDVPGELAAVDYAVLQKVLPLVASGAPGASPALVEALGAIEGLPLSAAALRRLGEGHR